MDGKDNSEKQQFCEPSTEEDRKQFVSEKVTDQNNWIPDEIQFCILRNLPAKSLMRFKCVNKSWNFMISDSDFINATPKFILRFSNSVFLMDYEDPVKERKLDLPTKPKPESVRARASCKGILWITVDHDEILWNPFTGEHKIMPIRSHRSTLLKNPPHISWIFDSGAAYGLGYDDTTKDFKIITISNDYNCLKPIIYSVKKDSCGIFEQNIPWYMAMTFHNNEGISVKNGSFCYWPLIHKCCTIFKSFCHFCHNSVDERHPLILGLDVVNRRQVLVPQPSGKNYVRSLFEFKGSLCLVKSDDSNWDMEMWLLKENWVKLMSVDMKGFDFLARPIYITEDEEVLMTYARCLLSQKRILSYIPHNTREKRFRSIEICGLDCWHQNILYTETLTSI